MNSALPVSEIWPELASIKAKITEIAETKNVSEVLLLTVLRDFYDRQLSSAIELGK